MSAPLPTLRERLEGALWGIFVADALSMPVHWYYDPRDIAKEFREIRNYQKPRDRHPTSIMDQCSTGRGGRGEASDGDVIGRVIMHGKKPFWGGPKLVHYHQGMRAGENTLNALCARVVLRSMAAAKGYSAAEFLSQYVAFMTTPGSHGDTYCESFHRDFFENFAEGIPPASCRGEPDEETAQIGGLVMPIAVAVACAPLGRAEAEKRALEQLRLTHLSEALEEHLRRWLDVLFVALAGDDIRPAIEEAGRPMDADFAKLLAAETSDVEIAHDRFGPACYIEDSLPVTLYFAYKHPESFEEAVLANTNVGGENCHRGSALGAILGAANGVKRIPRRLIDGLAASEAIAGEIRAVLDVSRVSVS